jgi:ABC-type uncharacterized transport system substrate-binding protein
MGALWLAGCASNPTAEPRTRAPAQSPLPPLSEHALVLVSDETPAYTQVAQALAQRLPGIPVHHLKGNSALADARLKEAPERNLVVAIGLDAAQAARRLDGRQVVFCQVFNYRDAGLVTPWMKGVSALPPANLQFGAWKSVSPGLKRVGLITGRGLGELRAEAREAARRVGIELLHEEVATDKQMLYAFRRLSPRIQGLWLVPDNRVLSREVMREVLAEAMRAGKQVVVFTPDLLKLGGLMSMESDAADVAQQVIARLREAQAAPDAAGTPIRELSRVKLRLNPSMLQHLGLSRPARFGEGVDVF